MATLPDSWPLTSASDPSTPVAMVLAVATKRLAAGEKCLIVVPRMESDKLLDVRRELLSISQDIRTIHYEPLKYSALVVDSTDDIAPANEAVYQLIEKEFMGDPANLSGLTVCTDSQAGIFFAKCLQGMPCRVDGIHTIYYHKNLPRFHRNIFESYLNAIWNSELLMSHPHLEMLGTFELNEHNFPTLNGIINSVVELRDRVDPVEETYLIKKLNKWIYSEAFVQLFNARDIPCYTIGYNGVITGIHPNKVTESWVNANTCFLQNYKLTGWVEEHLGIKLNGVPMPLSSDRCGILVANPIGRPADHTGACGGSTCKPWVCYPASPIIPGLAAMCDAPTPIVTDVMCEYRQVKFALLGKWKMHCYVTSDTHYFVVAEQDKLYTLFVYVITSGTTAQLSDVVLLDERLDAKQMTALGGHLWFVSSYRLHHYVDGVTTIEPVLFPINKDSVLACDGKRVYCFTDDSFYRTDSCRGYVVGRDITEMGVADDILYLVLRGVTQMYDINGTFLGRGAMPRIRRLLKQCDQECVMLY